MQLPTEVLGPLKVAIARHRRILAAVCAGLATLLTLSLFLDTRAAPAVDLASRAPAQQVTATQVAVPILLADAQLAAGVSPGDFVDLVRLSDSSPAVVIAEHARVLTKGSSGSPFSAGSSAMLVVAVETGDAPPVASAGASASLTLMLQPGLS